MKKKTTVVMLGDIDAVDRILAAIDTMCDNALVSVSAKSDVLEDDEVPLDWTRMAGAESTDGLPLSERPTDWRSEHLNR